ncbi:alpha/beta fold hydrolase [Sphingosinicella soli]|uniref:Pimeloyl-ACP methyl ester carboxylesterase n=1 Tax=Sphingosinicella soli TaxID=333708 RepID=A0A7W7B195_9SPHN|nr:pimeloyl-ACP methyl ester carboxylesterase [Sphingosinicella soli]
MSLQTRDRDFEAPDGARIAWTEAGPEDGRPLVLLHGLFSNAHINWVKFGTAARIAEAGLRLIMPDFRAHGKSAGPTDAASYPPDVLAGDVLALIDHLGLTDYDLGGYSLGGRQTLRAVIRGATPRRIAVIGMGLGAVVKVAPSTNWFIDTVRNADAHARGSDAYFAIQFMRTNAIDPQAAIHLLNAQVDSARADIAAITLPALVLCGAEDHYNAEAHALSEVLPNATWQEIPGTHMSSVTRPELGSSLAAFFTA